MTSMSVTGDTQKIRRVLSHLGYQESSFPNPEFCKIKKCNGYCYAVHKRGNSWWFYSYDDSYHRIKVSAINAIQMSGQATSSVKSALNPTETPCRYGKDCFRNNCRFRHDLPSSEPAKAEPPTDRITDDAFRAAIPEPLSFSEPAKAEPTDGITDDAIRAAIEEAIGYEDREAIHEAVEADGHLKEYGQ